MMFTNNVLRIEAVKNWAGIFSHQNIEGINNKIQGINHER